MMCAVNKRNSNKELMLENAKGETPNLVTRPSPREAQVRQIRQASVCQTFVASVEVRGLLGFGLKCGAYFVLRNKKVLKIS